MILAAPAGEALEPVLSLRDISVTFGGVKALQDVSFEVLPGEVRYRLLVLDELEAQRGDLAFERREALNFADARGDSCFARALGDRIVEVGRIENDR